MLKYCTRFVSLAAFIAWLGVDAGQAQQVNRAYCGDPGRVNVLVGAFAVSGRTEADTRNDLTRTLDRIFIGVIAGLFDATKNISASVWDAEAKRRFTQDQISLVDNAPVPSGGISPAERERAQQQARPGAPGGPGDPQGFTARLAQFLRTHHCDFLLTARITRDGTGLIVIPVVFDARSESYVVEENIATRKLRPIIQDPELPVNRAAESLFAQFYAYLQDTRKNQPESAQLVAIACFRLSGGTPTEQRSAWTTLEAAQAAALTRLQTDPRWKIPVGAFAAPADSKPGDGSKLRCPPPNQANASPSTIATLEGDVAINKGLIVLKSILLRVVQKGNPATSFEIPFLGDPIIGRLAADADVYIVRTFAEQSRRLLSIVTTAEGIILPGKDETVPSMPSMLSFEVTKKLSDKRPEEALILAYKALGRNQNDTTAMVSVARALLVKSESSLASRYIYRTLSLTDKIPAAERGAFYEGIGNFYDDTSRRETAIEFLLVARDSYAALNAKDAAADVNRAIARIYLKLDKDDEASRVLLEQADYEKDVETLFQLAVIAYSKSDFEKTIEWLEKASKVDTNNAGIRVALGTVYQSMAQREEVARRYTEARSFIEKAISYDERPTYLYRAGSYAYHEGGEGKEKLYDIAIGYYERAMNAKGVTQLTIENSLLTILECLLLKKDWEGTEKRAQDSVQKAFARKPDAIFITQYIELLATTLKAPQEPVEAIKDSETYKKYSELLKTISEDHYTWNNDKIQALIDAQADLSPKRKEFAQDLTREFMGTLRKGRGAAR